MGLDIDITDLKSRELIKILTLYPQGHLEIKYERVFWISDYAEPDSAREEPRMNYRAQQGAPQGSSASKPFERMADTLGQMVCMPSRR